MTVRVSKPAFNLRDKLSELDVPVGSHGSQIMKSSSTEETFDLLGSGTGRKNVIVNGAMRFNQRGASSYDAPDYTLDRWRYHRSSDGEFDIKPSTVAPPGFSNSLHVDCKVASNTTSNTSYARMRYFVEGYDCQRFGKGTSNAKNFCLSFYVKSNVLGTYSINLQATSRVITRNYKVTDTDWHRYVIVFPNENVSPITNNNLAGLEIQFGLTHGTNYTGGDGRDGWTAHAANKEHTGANVRLWSSVNNNFYLTGVQLETGDVATPFEHLTYQEDLARCQRYFWREYKGTYEYSQGPSSGAGTLGQGYHPVTMRIKPTMSHSCTGNSVGSNAINSSAGQWTWYRQNTGYDSGDTSYPSVANWNFATSPLSWHGGSYHFKPNDTATTTALQTGELTYLQADAEL